MNSLSPTTRAATSGLKLNDPALNKNGTAAASPPNNAAISNGTNIDGGSKMVDNDNDSRLIPCHPPPPSAAAAAAAGGGGAAIGKENRQPLSYSPNAASDHNSELPQQYNHGEGKSVPLSEEMTTMRQQQSTTAAAAASSPQRVEGGSVQLCYFDENNVMDGAVAAAGGIGSCHQYNDDTNEYNDNEYDNNNYEADNSYEEDDYSEASGDTVVHNDCPPPPPPNATQEDLNRYYWEWCYGPVEDVSATTALQKSAVSSVMRSAPAKSCLSTNKKRNASNNNNTSMTPRRILHHSPMVTTSDKNTNMPTMLEETPHLSTPTEDTNEKDDTNDDGTTPKNNMTRLPPTRARTQSAVKFGHNKAAEFDFLQPITEMTPIPSAVVQRIFPSDIKETEKEVEEQGVSRETARNVALLAQWDDDFDSIIGEDEEEEEGLLKEGNKPPKKRGRKHTPYKSGRRSAGNSRPRKSRRESSLFSRERKSLIDECGSVDDDSMEMEGDNHNNSNGDGNAGNLLPFSVTIDPEEYTSPSSASISDSFSTLGSGSTPSAAADSSVAANDNEMRRMAREVRGESFDTQSSACISPSSLKSSESCCGISNNRGLENQHARDSNGGSGRDSIDSNTTTGKETPNSARTSSSTILRAMHSSGALLPGNSQFSPPSQLLQQGEMSSGSGGGEKSGLLRPNQLKYSPSSSSGGSASTARMDVSPSDSDSLGSDIMSLFTRHSLDNDADPNSLVLSQQLSIFSNHPTQPFHMSITDLIQWIGSTQMDPLAFMNEHILKGLSPLTSLSLIADENCSNNNESMFCGNSKWLQSALLFNENDSGKSKFVQKSFESMLLEEIKEISSSSDQSSSRSSQTRSTTMSDADLQTISSCIQQFHIISSMDWSSMELDAAMRSLSRLQEMAETMQAKTEDGDKFVASCCKKLMETSTLTMQQLAKSNDVVPSLNKKLKLRKRKVQSQMDETMTKIKSLEDQLTTEVTRLHQTKRAKQIFDTHLEMERSSPISVLSEEIRSSIVPAPMTANASNFASDFPFTYPLLDGSAEIAIKIATSEEEEDTASSSESPMELGCFIKDGGVAIKLLQAILLGNMETKVNETLGPFPLRESLSSMILQNESREESFLQMTHLFSRIDALVRSVRDLETNGFITVNETVDGDVTVTVSMHHEGTVVQTGFLFGNLLGKDWHATTTPSDVKVSIVSAERDLCVLGNQLQEKAQSILAGSSSSDPILLRRICDTVMENFAQAAVS
mmetsp:Transcript_14018/g.25300  ORF Transcript_14018/g.25300 Transcript_14018/m.25300 type:complete len:1244 (+) Transcript_14018:189-3920(+)